MSLRKRYFWVYARQTATLLSAANVVNQTVLATNVTGNTPWEGITDAHLHANYFARVGDMSSGGIVGLDEGAQFTGEIGENKMLASGDNPAISEKIAAALKSFAVTNAAWATAAESGAFGDLPVRKRLATIETGKNVDLCFVDVSLENLIAGESFTLYYIHNVPIHVGLEILANNIPALPITVEKEVSLLTDNIYVYTCTYA